MVTVALPVQAAVQKAAIVVVAVAIQEIRRRTVESVHLHAATVLLLRRRRRRLLLRCCPVQGGCVRDLAGMPVKTPIA